MNVRCALASAAVVFALIAETACFVGCSSPNSSTGVGNPGLTSEEQALVDDGSDANDGAAAGSSIAAIPTYAFTKMGELAGPTVARDVAVFSANYFPPSCAAATKVGTAQVTYTFTACKTGRATIDGKLDVVFSGGPGTIDFTVASNGLTVDGAVVTENANGSLTIDATGKRTLKWNGEYDGTTLRGYPIKHTADYTIIADSSCVTIDGSSTTTITRDGADHGFTATVAGYVHCGPRRSCPLGGTVTLTTLDKKLSLEVRFLGGPHAQIKTSRGLVADAPLKCG